MGFHGCSFSAESPFVAGLVSSSFGTWMPGVVIVEVTTVRSVRRPDTELWEASHLPDSFPLQPLLSWFSDTLGSAHPGCPLSLSFPPFSSPPRSLLFTPSLPISLIFSLSRPSVLSRAPCVTRIIKTNTDLILVSNPVVLFFLLTGPGACWVLGVHSHTAPPPGLFLDFKQSGASHMVGK